MLLGGFRIQPCLSLSNISLASMAAQLQREFGGLEFQHGLPVKGFQGTLLISFLWTQHMFDLSMRLP